MTLSAPHATLAKFGYPANLLHQGEHWALLVRPSQPTLGSLVLCSISAATAYGSLPPGAYTEQGGLLPRLELMLRRFAGAEKINYLMLMMVDPHVHFHVIPRYPGERLFAGDTFPDSGWPGLPNLATNVAASPGLVARLQQEWDLSS